MHKHAYSIHFISNVSLKWYENIQIDSFRSLINLFYVVKHEKRKECITQQIELPLSDSSESVTYL